MTPAEAYSDLCFTYIPGLPLTQWDLRGWWDQQETARGRYELSDAEEAELLGLSRVIIWQLPEGAPPPKPQLRRGQIGQRQGTQASTRRPQPKRRYG